MHRKPTKAAPLWTVPRALLIDLKPKAGAGVVPDLLPKRRRFAKPRADRSCLRGFDFSYPGVPRPAKEAPLLTVPAVRRSVWLAGTQECPICQEGILDTECVQMPCEHLFHTECIGQWLHQTSACPLLAACRFALGALGPVHAIRTILHVCRRFRPSDNHRSAPCRLKLVWSILHLP